MLEEFNVQDAKKFLELERNSDRIMNRAYAVAILDLLSRIEALENQIKNLESGTF